MTKRRPKGEGSVYRRKDGRVVGEYEDATGRKRYITSKTMTKAEMKAKVRKALEDRDNGITHDSVGLMIAGYLDCWLESTRDTVGLRTYQRSEETARLHITPTLGKGKLEKLTAMQLDGLYRNKLKAGLSPRSVQIIHATAQKALKQAVRWRLVRENVPEHATPPKTVRRHTNPLIKVQTMVLLRTAKRMQPKLYALYALAVTTGARLGELLALDRLSVNIQAGTLSISKSVHNGRITAPKTSAGRQTSDYLSWRWMRYATISTPTQEMCGCSSLRSTTI